MMNSVQLVGRVAKPLVLNNTNNSGKAVTNMILACERPGAKPDPNNDGKVPVDFPNVVIWGEMAKNSCKYLGLGDLAGVVGRVQTRSYQDSTGKTQFVTEIVADQVKFLGKSKKNLESSNQSHNNQANDNQHYEQDNNNNNSGWDWNSSSSSNEDEYPF
ncbi:single-stranded DNA-binding protein [Sutcliffiella sp. NPDC057660]|uniref:single-stranded DNA-binding protein n=1 Tax=Sutcliffiella sp. NPDC057660 TaxID=3346199 RepID=UPI00369FAA64